MAIQIILLAIMITVSATLTQVTLQCGINNSEADERLALLQPEDQT
jgi:hypothetical protein